MQAALNEVVKWTTKEGLSISPQKTVVIPFTNKRNIEGLGPLTLLGRQLQLLGGVLTARRHSGHLIALR
jgi:hypothetical protein